MTSNDIVIHIEIVIKFLESRWIIFSDIVIHIEIVIKFLESRWITFSARTNVVKIAIPKMADTSKDKLLLGGGIPHVAVCRCIRHTVNKFLLN